MRRCLSRVVLATAVTAAMSLPGLTFTTPVSAAGTAEPSPATARASQAWVFWARYYDLGQCLDVGDQGLRLGLWNRHSCEANDIFGSWDLWVQL